MRTIMLGIATVLSCSAAAEVVDTQPWGFKTRNEVTVTIAPDEAYRSIASDVGKWWDPEHTYSGVSKNMTIDPRPGGCFCEKIPGKGAIEHARVIYISAPETLRLDGALGPLQQSGVTGALTWTVKAAEGGGSTITQEYSVGGYLQGGFYEMAPLVDWVMATQVSRLKRFLETGDPAAPK